MKWILAVGYFITLFISLFLFLAFSTAWVYVILNSPFSFLLDCLYSRIYGMVGIWWLKSMGNSFNGVYSLEAYLLSPVWQWTANKGKCHRYWYSYKIRAILWNQTFFVSVKFRYFAKGDHFGVIKNLGFS